jgi:hypothetical protein
MTLDSTIESGLRVPSHTIQHNKITMTEAHTGCLSHSRQPSLFRLLSVGKVVPTLTSNSAEIYLSMAGAKQLVAQGLSWIGGYVQQWCARGTTLRCTIVLAEGGYKRGGRGSRASKFQRFLIEASANIVVKAVSVRVCLLLSCPSAARGLPPPFIGQGEAVYRCAALC